MNLPYESPEFTHNELVYDKTELYFGKK